KAFFDVRRIARGRPALNLDYAFEVVFNRIKPLDYEGVLSRGIPLHIAVTDVADLRTIAASEFSSGDDLKAALRASAWLPLVTFGTATFRGRQAIDGGILATHPREFAIADDCSHILSLSTRPMDRTRRPPLVEPLAALRLERMQRGLGTAYL